MIKVDEREIPGLTPLEWREFRYVSDDGSDNFNNVKNGLFIKVLSQISPDIPKTGGAITENCKIWLPSGELLHALSYKGDIEGWREQVEQGAKLLGLFTGKILEDKIILSDGRSFKLVDCTIDLY